MKIIIDEASEDKTTWKLTGQKIGNDCIQLTIGDYDSEANIVVNERDLIKMINILIDLKNG